jgi:glycogen(starch) synthase
LGRLTEQKGFDIAVRALRAVVNRFPNVRLTIAGDGPERHNLEQLVSELGLEQVVDFIGWVAPEQVPALLNTATVVIMPSRWEGLPLVALEAALMARPLVVTPVEGLPEVVIHQRTGLLVEKENSEALAEAIGFLLSRPEAAAAMGQAARRHVQAVFSFENCVNAYEAVYRRLATVG